jgi:hypothetical protein
VVFLRDQNLRDNAIAENALAGVFGVLKLKVYAKSTWSEDASALAAALRQLEKL